MDSETKKVIGEQKGLQSLVSHESWGVARQKLIDKILDLQNAFNILDVDEKSMFIDLKARKIATEILVEWLREVEGTAQEAVENKDLIQSAIVRLN